MNAQEWPAWNVGVDKTVRQVFNVVGPLQVLV